MPNLPTLCKPFDLAFTMNLLQRFETKLLSTFFFALTKYLRNNNLESEHRCTTTLYTKGCSLCALYYKMLRVAGSLKPARGAKAPFIRHKTSNISAPASGSIRVHISAAVSAYLLAFKTWKEGWGGLGPNDEWKADRALSVFVVKIGETIENQPGEEAPESRRSV